MSYYFQSIIDLHLVPFTFSLLPLSDWCRSDYYQGRFYVCLITIQLVNLNIPQQVL